MKNSINIFVSFDYENDKDIKGCFISQAKKNDLTCKVNDLSLTEPCNEKWRSYVRELINKSDIVVVICGKYTDKANGVSGELSITRELNKPYILLRGRRGDVIKPSNTRKEDQIVQWNWKELREIFYSKMRGK